jgi:hypothetical protein
MCLLPRATLHSDSEQVDCKSVIDDLFFNAFTVIILIYNVLCDHFGYNFWQLFLSVIFLKDFFLLSFGMNSGIIHYCMNFFLQLFYYDFSLSFPPLNFSRKFERQKTRAEIGGPCRA